MTKFVYHKKANQLFSEETELTGVRYDEKKNPYWVFEDSRQHWIKLHLTPKGNLKKVFYKKIDHYFLKEWKQATSQKVIVFQLGKYNQVVKQLSGWEPKFKKPKKKNWILK